MAYQFIHIEAVSKAGRDIYRKINRERKKIGNTSIYSILGEAGRYNGYIEHVENPLPPVIIFGDKEKSVESVLEKITEWYENSKDSRGHKVRVDANALLAGVVSWPPISDNEDENEYLEKRELFEADLIKWLKKVYGDDLKLVLRHDDEPFHGLNAGKIHYHWHYFCVKKSGQKFNLHPGFLERSKYDVPRKDRKNMIKEEYSEILREGKKAYREAMIEFQDNFHYELGRYHGLNRMGPMRIRRSRSEQVELEKRNEKELAYPKKVMNEAIIMKNDAISTQKQAEIIIQDAKKIKDTAENEREILINEGKNIKEKLINEANNKSKNIIDAAWNTANNIYKIGEKKANEIFKNAKEIIINCVNYISEFQYGNKVVDRINKFLKIPDGSEKEFKEELKNEKNKKQNESKKNSAQKPQMDRTY